MADNVNLCVGGARYTTARQTLTSVPESKLANWFQKSSTGAASTAGPSAVSSSKFSSSVPNELSIDNKGRYIIDRDGELFRHVLNYLRNRCQLALPQDFTEHQQLRLEAEYYGLNHLVGQMSQLISANALLQKTGALSLSPTSAASGNGSISGYNVVKGTGGPGCITVGYRGSFAFGRDGLADVKFRKLTKILVSGKVTLCREVFGDTLNESRDPDHGEDENRYTARFFLKHLCLEQAFDCLHESGFRNTGACGSGTSSIPATEPVKPGIDSEETRWNHYNEFIFCRF